MGLSPRWLSAPLRSLGATAHGRINPASTLNLWLRRSIIITLYLSSPPSGCNPDSDLSPLSLSSGEGLREVEVNLAWNFNSGTSNVPYGLVIFSCQGPVKSEKLSLHLYWTEKPFCQGCFWGENWKCNIKRLDLSQNGYKSRPSNCPSSVWQ